jgi:hypothetical protein
LKPYNPEGFRYTQKEFPPYRHVPGLTPHPRCHPQGHRFGQIEEPVEPFDVSSWKESLDYLYGVDLYNFAFYWEAHEAWEGIWKTTARRDTPGLYLQGLIQISAALIKRHQGIAGGKESLSRAGFRKLRSVAEGHPRYGGLEMAEYIERMVQIFADPDRTCWPADPRIRLAGIMHYPGCRAGPAAASRRGDVSSPG